MTRLEHDSAASLKVERLASAGNAAQRNSHSGWYVVRTCPCHQGETVSVPFGSREQAERCLAVLDEDARKRG